MLKDVFSSPRGNIFMDSGTTHVTSYILAYSWYFRKTKPQVRIDRTNHSCHLSSRSYKLGSTPHVPFWQSQWSLMTLWDCKGNPFHRRETEIPRKACFSQSYGTNKGQSLFQAPCSLWSWLRFGIQLGKWRLCSYPKKGVWTLSHLLCVMCALGPLDGFSLHPAGWCWVPACPELQQKTLLSTGQLPSWRFAALSVSLGVGSLGLHSSGSFFPNLDLGGEETPCNKAQSLCPRARDSHDFSQPPMHLLNTYSIPQVLLVAQW